MFNEIEGTGFESLDPRFDALFTAHIRIERLWTGARWSEGPAWFAAGRYLIWSDIPNNRMLRWDETDGSVSVFREPSNNSNGNTVDQQGRLITCEHLTRCVTRTEHDGSISVLANKFEGKRFNSPNDVVVKSDGSVWFTDPFYGIDSCYEGVIQEQEIEGCHVYRIDPSNNSVQQMTTDFNLPNGLAFSPDEKILYISDTGGTHDRDFTHHIRRFEVQKDSSLQGGDVFAKSEHGLYDGFRLDEEGRLWTSCYEGVHCYDPDGTLIGKIHIPEIVGNLTFGGPKGNRLLICGNTSIYSVFVFTTGA